MFSFFLVSALYCRPFVCVCPLFPPLLACSSTALFAGLGRATYPSASSCTGSPLSSPDPRLPSGGAVLLLRAAIASFRYAFGCAFLSSRQYRSAVRSVLASLFSHASGHFLCSPLAPSRRVSRRLFISSVSPSLRCLLALLCPPSLLSKGKKKLWHSRTSPPQSVENHFSLGSRSQFVSRSSLHMSRSS